MLYYHHASSYILTRSSNGLPACSRQMGCFLRRWRPCDPGAMPDHSLPGSQGAPSQPSTTSRSLDVWQSSRGLMWDLVPNCISSAKRPCATCPTAPCQRRCSRLAGPWEDCLASHFEGCSPDLCVPSAERFVKSAGPCAPGAGGPPSQGLRPDNRPATAPTAPGPAHHSSNRWPSLPHPSPLPPLRTGGCRLSSPTADCWSPAAALSDPRATQTPPRTNVSFASLSLTPTRPAPCTLLFPVLSHPCPTFPQQPPLSPSIAFAPLRPRIPGSAPPIQASSAPLPGEPALRDSRSVRHPNLPPPAQDSPTRLERRGQTCTGRSRCSHVWPCATACSVAAFPGAYVC